MRFQSSSIKNKIQTILKNLRQEEESLYIPSDEDLSILEEYECWSPYRNLLNQLINNTMTRNLDHYLRLVHVQKTCHETSGSIVQTCKRMILDLHVDYETFSQVVIPSVLDEGDHNLESDLLSHCYLSFPRVIDRIKCLEKLALLHEKKLFNDSKLSWCYNTIAELDPFNIKTLKYFKSMYIQSNNWEESINILQTLYIKCIHPNDKFRIAHELANIQLYHLSLPQKALETLDNLCPASFLDSSSIRFDAYLRLEDWDACIKILTSQINKTEKASQKGVLLYKIGELNEKINNQGQALYHYIECLKISADFMEAYEKVICLASKLGQWLTVAQYLLILTPKVQHSELKRKLLELSIRIKSSELI